MKMNAAFKVHERLMLKVGDGWLIRRIRQNHLKTVHVMKHKEHGQDEVSEAALAKLTALGWLKAVPLDAVWDQVEYEVTRAGHDALAKLWHMEGEKR